jgi:hypothetical protein
MTGRGQAAYRLELAQADAGQALAVAEEAVSLADQIIREVSHEQ